MRNQRKKRPEKKKKATSRNPFLLFLSFVLFCLHYPQPNTKMTKFGPKKFLWNERLRETNKIGKKKRRRRQPSKNPSFFFFLSSSFLFIIHNPENSYIHYRIITAALYKFSKSTKSLNVIMYKLFESIISLFTDFLHHL